METRFCVGDKVRMQDNRMHNVLPEHYPDYRVIGEVVKVHTKALFVNWGEDSGTLGDHTWVVEKSFIVKVEE